MTLLNIETKKLINYTVLILKYMSMFKNENIAKDNKFP